MYAFLLVLGAAITAAGLALVASGVSLQDRAFDVSNATPGIVAFVGGCILIGLGLVVRALARVERALITKPMHAGHPSETPADTSTERATEPRIPLPTEPKAAIEAAAPPVAPSADRIESAPVVDAADVSLLPNAPGRPEGGNGVADPSLPKLNGSAHATAVPRVTGAPTRPQQPKNSLFDTLWPKASRPATPTQPAATQPAAVAPASHIAEPAPNAAPPPAAPTQTPAGVSILKSGVVEGMAYTLYSDGSIEAELPGGTLRFRSITELRSHIEQNG